MKTEFFILLAIVIAGAPSTLVSAADEARPADKVSHLATEPVRFEPNRGQASSAVSFIGRARDYTVIFEKRSVHLMFRPTSEAARATVIDLSFIGSNSEVEPVGAEPLGGTTNYFLGNDPALWKRGVPNYGRVIEHGLYEGVDAVFHSDGHNIEYDFVVSPGRDPGVVRLKIEGAEATLDDTGALLLRSNESVVRMDRPLAYQSIASEKRMVPVRYLVDAGPVIGFELGEYDRSQSLIIDPTLVFSTYLGGSGEDVGNSVVTDSSGNVYVTGRTTSNDFPVVDGWQDYRAGARDAFVTKYSPTGDMIYSTYFGGTGAENAIGVGLDASGAIYVTGVTSSIDLPVKNAAQSTYGGGGQDGFVFKLTPDGDDLVYSTYLGGTGFDQSRTIAVDADGYAYVAGNTDSPNFPLLNALQPTFGGGISDAFVAKLDSNGALVFSTYLGGTTHLGNDFDSGRGIALDASGDIYVAGETRGAFPVTSGAFQTTYGGGLNDLFVAKLSSDGARLVYATYVGGSGSDQTQIVIGTSSGIHGKIIAVDRDGNAYITGDTDSSDFPVRNAYQPSKSGDVDAFVLKLNAAGSDVVYSTYFGGSGFDTARGIAITTGGRAWIVGSTASSDLPVRSPFQSAFGGGAFDAFLAEFSRQGQLRFASYWGGGGLDAGWSIATDRLDGVTATGETTSLGFPTQNASQPSYSGGTTDAFVLRLQLD